MGKFGHRTAMHLANSEDSNKYFIDPLIGIIGDSHRLHAGIAGIGKGCLLHDNPLEG